MDFLHLGRKVQGNVEPPYHFWFPAGSPAPAWGRTFCLETIPGLPHPFGTRNDGREVEWIRNEDTEGENGIFEFDQKLREGP